MSPDMERRLIERLRAQDPSVLEILMEQYGPRLYRVAFGITRSHGDAVVRRAYQEHGVVEADPAHPLDLPVGAKLRIAPNHTCMTAAAHDRYFVVEGSDEVVAIWPRVNGW